MTSVSPRQAHRGAVLVSMAAAVAIVTLDTTILNVAIPTIRRDFGTDLASLQWVITGYSLTLGSLLIIGGRVGDLFGTRRAFVSGAALFAGGSLLASLAENVPVLLLGEAIIEGIGAALLFPASLATLSTVFEGPSRAKAFAIWGAIAGSAAALGPVLGGWLTTDHSWRWGFRINVVIAPLAAILALVALPADQRRAPRPRLDVVGALLAAVTMFMIVFALTEGPEHGWLTNQGRGLALGGARLWRSASPASPVVPAFAIAAIGAALFLGYERRSTDRSQDPLIDLRLFANRGFSGGLITAATVVMAQAGTMFVLAVFLQTTHHLEPIAAGRWLLPVGLGVLAGAQAGGRIATKAGPTLVVRAGIVVQLTGVLVAAAILDATTTWEALAAPLTLFGIGSGLASSQLTNVILSNTPRERAGSASGVATTNNALGAAFGVTILGAVLRARTFGDASSSRWALAAAAGLLGVGALASSVLPRLRPPAKTSDTPLRSRDSASAVPARPTAM